MSLAHKADDDLAAKLSDLADKYFAIAMEMGVDYAESLLHNNVSPELEAKLRKDLEARLASNDDYIETSLLPAMKDGLEGEALAARVGLYASQVYPTANAGFVSALGGSGIEFEWVLDESVIDHCDVCPKIADGGPYSDPDDDDSDLPSLPTMPGEDVPCMSNCRCRVAVTQPSWNAYTASYDTEDP